MSSNDGGKLLIRAVEATDYPAWKERWDAYSAFYGRHGPTALAPEITSATWERFLDPSEPVHALVALREGSVLGLAQYLFHRSTILVAPTCYLQDLFTSELARGQGVGRALISSVYERAAEAGSTRVYWQTHESNATAIRLYETIAERSGFIVYRKTL